MTQAGPLPRYRDLPIADGGARSAWGLFGSDDQVGRMNLQTAETVREAAGSIRSGEVFPLDLPRGLPDPALFHRSGARRTRVEPRTDWYFDDVFDNDYPQAGTQWDALGHIGYRAGEFYNGATAAEVRAGQKNGIEHWARRGIAGRGVLLDLTIDSDHERASAHAFTVSDLEAARSRAGITYRPGDILVLHTGFLADHLQSSPEARARQAQRIFTQAPGIEHTEAMAEYLWDAGVSGVVADNPTVEVFPPDERPEAWPFGYLHYVLIGQLGFGLGELWWLDDLAKACAGDGRYEFFVSSAPTHSVGAVGGHANALAIR